MKTRYMLVATAALLFTACAVREDQKRSPSPGEPDRIELRDAVGKVVSIPRPATRVISLAPNLTEDIFAVGGGGKLVGRTSFCNYPPAALTVPVVGDLQSFSFEKMVSL